MLKKLEAIIADIQNNSLYESYDGGFPDPEDLFQYPENNLPVIVEQADRIIANKYDPKKHTDDREQLAESFISDIRLFLTENNIQLDNNNLVGWGQQVIPSNSLYHIACSKEYAMTYQNIDLLANPSVFDSFSVPFIIRLAIENKIKTMIGFKSCALKTKIGIKEATDQFPFTIIINFLINNDLLESPCSFQQIKNIYSWSCRFTHTAKREYVWLKLKALECLHPLFDHESGKKYYPKNSKYSNILYYLKDEVTLDQLENKINNDTKIKERFIFNLSNDKFEENYGFYSSKYSKYF